MFLIFIFLRKEREKETKRDTYREKLGVYGVGENLGRVQRSEDAIVLVSVLVL